MRVLLLIILLVPVSSPGQSRKADEDPNLVVVKFSWKRDRRYWSGRLPQTAADDWPPAGAVSAGGSPAEMSSVEDQFGAMRQSELKARRSRASAVQEFYRYKVTLRNTDARAIRAFYWSFETRQSQRPDDVSRLHFFCSAKVKPGKSREIEVQTMRAPSLTVGAGTDASPDQVVINRVEYADGTVWKRPGWSHRPVTWRRGSECVEIPSPRRR